MTHFPKNALIIGSSSAIGQALVTALNPLQFHIHKLSRENCDYSEPNLAEAALKLQKYGPFQKIFNCVGVLHNQRVSPERSLRQINPEVLAEYFQVNTILPMVCMKHFLPLLDQSQVSVYANLSAMVGSIGDNRLGGWYGYRSSKAALNMLVKTTAIEMGRKNKQAVVVAIHPGTTKSSMSKPFSRNVMPEKYYDPAVTAGRMLQVVDGLTPAHSGGFYNWNGDPIAW